jgi:hypothetical protein
MMLEQVSHHEHPLLSLSQGNQACAFKRIKAKRLFDEDVFAGVERCLGQLVMQSGWSGDRNLRDVGVS